MKLLELPGIVIGGAILFVISLLFSLLITLPVSAVLAAGLYPLLATVRRANKRVIGILGLLVGALVWLGLFWLAPEGILFFGSWTSVFLVGGPAGCAGDLAFARHLGSLTESLD